MKVIGSDPDHHPQSQPLLHHTSASTTTTSADACMNIVHSLMCHRKGGESEEFSKFAIESLIKKLKDRRSELDALILAVTSNGAEPTSCVNIQRTLDSRMQIAGRKCFPHVIYARLWRWPDAHKTELRHYPSCEYGFDRKLDWVCVNPFHYERVIPSALDISSLALSPPVERRTGMCRFVDAPLIATNVDKDGERQRRHSSDSNQQNPVLRLSVQALLDEGSSRSGGLKPEPPKSCTIAYEVPATSVPNIFSQPPAAALPQPKATGSTAGPGLDATNFLSLVQWVTNANATLAAVAAIGSSSQNNADKDEDTGETSMALDAAAEAAALLDPVAAGGGIPAPILFPENEQQPRQRSGGGSNNGGGVYSGGAYNSGGRQPSSASSSSAPPTHSGAANSQMAGGGWGGGGGGGGGSMLPPNAPPGGLQQPGGQLTAQRPPEYWCHIAYYELDQQVGELFKVPSHYTRVIVDGYTDPSSRNRFCLGQLSNVHRSEQSEKSRLYIGKGVELDIVGEGDVWIRCLSDFSIFVQSYYLDREAGRAPGDAVHKIYPGAYIKVFDIRQCYEQMRLLAHMAQAAAVRQAAAVSGSLQPHPTPTSVPPPAATLSSLDHPPPPGTVGVGLGTSEAAGVGVDDLQRLCNLRLSFVKGWGPDYRRLDIKETPCWIQIQLHRPLQLLDEVLQAMPLNDLKPTRHFFPYYQNQQQTAAAPPSQHLGSGKR